MSASYFVRSRGRISGPFVFEALQHLVRRGSLSRFDELSTDRIRWAAADSVPALFGVAEPAPPPSSYSQTSTAAPPTPSAQGPRYYYSQRGIDVGPVESGVLRSLAASGAVGGDDMVWTEGSEVAYYAHQIPLLAAMFTAHGASNATARPSRGTPASPALARAIKDIQHAATVVGIVCGGLMLILSNLPLASVNGELLWWWDAPSSTVTGSGIYLNAAGGALIVLALVVKGMARALPTLILTCFPILLLFVFYNDVVSPIEGVFAKLTMAAPLLAVFTLLTARWRMIVGPSNHRLTISLLGAILGAISFVMAILLFVIISRPHGPFVPGWVRGVEALFLLQIVSQLIAAVHCLVNVSSGSAFTGRAVQVLGMTSLGLSIAAYLAMFAGLASSMDLLSQLAGGGPSAVFNEHIRSGLLLIARGGVMLVCLIAGAGVAFAELIQLSHSKSAKA